MKSALITKGSKLFIFLGALGFFLFSVYCIYHTAFFFGHRVLENGNLGGDTPYHAALMYALNRFYPSIPIWFPFAGAGSSLILGYWSFSYYMAIAGSHVFSLTIEQMVRILEFAAAPLTALGIYGYIWIRFKNQYQAFLGSLLYFLSSMAWGWIAHAGFFAMHMSAVLYMPTFLFFDLYLEEVLTRNSLQRRRLYLFFSLLLVAFGMLVHGSFIPNLYLGLPLYALVRSQFAPRSRPRLGSALVAVKAVTVFVVLGVVVSAFILIPQQSYFNLQPFTPVYGAQDTPDLPWRGFVGLERLSGRIGSLYTPLFMSLLVSAFAGIGIVIGFVKRHRISALSITALFYIGWLSAAKSLALNFAFLQFFLLTTATRAASFAAILITILASYGLWEVSNIPRAAITLLLRKVSSKQSVVQIVSVLLIPVSIVTSVALLYVAIPKFKDAQTFPVDSGEWGIVEGYSGYGSLGFDIPFCNFERWSDEVDTALMKTCDDYNPHYRVDAVNADFWRPEMAQEIEKLDLTRNTRVSVSPYLGWVTFSFTRHSEASMVSAPSGQSIINLEWLGIHDVDLFLDGTASADEVKEMVNLMGTRYVFFEKPSSERIWYRYPDSDWKTVLDKDPLLVKEFTESRGIATVSSKPTILVIGSEEFHGYDAVQQVALKGMLSFDDAVLIDAREENIDAFSSKDLAAFDMVFLRGYSYKNSRKAWNVLDQYVSEGGSLFVDTGWQFVDEDWGVGPDASGTYGVKKLPEVFPVSETTWSSVGPTWEGYTLSTDSNLTLKDLGEPRWGELAWGASVATTNALRDWATPVISDQNTVVLARGTYGKGRVVWSGMNLVSHAFDKTSEGEYELLNDQLHYLLGEHSVSYATTEFSWTDPDRITVSFEGAKPNSVLYFAQTYTPQWKAYWVDTNNKLKELPLYRAGVGFQAVHIPEGMESGKIVLILDYSKIFVVSFLISGSVFLFLIALMADSAFNHSAIQNMVKVKREVSGEKRHLRFDNTEDHTY